MYRAIPVSNKVVEKKSQQRAREKQQKKLFEMKPSVPDDRPDSLRPIRRNFKKEAQEEERYTEIERCNRLLLERLTGIMKKNNKNSGNEQQKFRVRSLNRDARKRELVKITIENQNLLKRIQNQKSKFSVQNWLDSHRQKQIYLQNISEFPIQLYSNNTPRVAGTADEEDGGDTFRELSSRRPRTHENNKHPRSVSPISHISNSPMNGLSDTARGISDISTPVQGRPSERITASYDSRKENQQPAPQKSNTATPKRIIYQAARQFGANMYLVQFYIQNRMFRIVASNTEKSGLKMFSAIESEGERILERHKHNFELIMDRMKFRGTQIVFDADFIGMPDASDNFSSTNTKSKTKDAIVLNQEYFEKALTSSNGIREDTNFSNDDEEPKQDTASNNFKTPIKGLSNVLKENQRNEQEEEQKQVNMLTFRTEGLEVIAEDP